MIINRISEYIIKKKTEKYKKAGIMRFFHYDFGSMGDGMTSFTLSEEDGVAKLIFQKTSMADGKEDVITYDLPLTAMQLVKRTITEEKIFLWNGFNKSNSVIATGCSFNLSADFDNYKLRASGMSMMPPLYSEKHDELYSRLSGLMEVAQ